jgi:hypothetical protein
MIHVPNLSIERTSSSKPRLLISLRLPSPVLSTALTLATWLGLRCSVTVNSVFGPFFRQVSVFSRLPGISRLSPAVAAASIPLTPPLSRQTRLTRRSTRPARKAAQSG